MMVVLPNDGKMEHVEAFINKDYLKHVHEHLFRTTWGVVSAFGNTADFSAISEETKLKVSKVTHKAVLSVDEKGTEAAAVTTTEIMPMSLPDTIMLNRPFACSSSWRTLPRASSSWASWLKIILMSMLVW
ncbi:hypothetical protein J4Q44_G00322630 [Coregonus suidteri]|uniref:Serpin domain-containing protein n=1 Tax=Coregonus suidteri TaxID=861788 RepID=A0AAN8QAJ2_9TELE